MDRVVLKKTLSLLILLVFILSVLSGCGGKSNGFKGDGAAAEEEERSMPEAPEDGVYTMRIGHAQSLTSPRHRSLEMFKEEVENKTGGKVLVEIYPEGELGNETEMTNAVSEGELEAVRGGDLEFVPETMMLGLPMIADDINEARKLCYSDFVKNMLKGVEERHNMKVLAVGDDSGFRQITNNVHPIKKPSDMKGLKMRTILEVIDLSMQKFGASTVMIPFTELYEALEEGTVDGQENPLALIDSNKFYEVQKYCTIIDYMFFAELMYVNLDWWNSLPAEYRELISDSARGMMDENARITDEENETYLKHIQENGCEVYVLSKEERDVFKPLAEEVWKEYVESGRISKEELDEMLAVIGKTAGF